MRCLLALLTFLPVSDSPPRVEVRGVEVSGAWLSLSERSYVAVYHRGPDGVRLLSPDTSTTWVPLDSGAASVQFTPLPSGVMSPVNCVVTPRELLRWDPASQSVIPIRSDDCGPMPPSATGPGRAVPGRPGQGPADAWYIPRPNDAADRKHYLIVVATDGDMPPPHPESVLDDRLRGVPPLYAAQVLGERLGRGTRDWTVVVVPLSR